MTAAGPGGLEGLVLTGEGAAGRTSKGVGSQGLKQLPGKPERFRLSGQGWGSAGGRQGLELCGVSRGGGDRRGGAGRGGGWGG